MSIDGPFALGSTIVMELEGRRNVALVITAFDDGRRFVTESPGPGVTIIFDHLIVETPGHFSGVVTTITHTVTIDGPNVDNVGEHMGKVITHDLPDTLAAIAGLAENVRDAAMR